MVSFRLFQRLEAAQTQRLEASTGHASPYSFDAAYEKQNIKKNRYRDILPFDATRVRLSRSPDYINASFIDNGSRKFIATQGPLDDTINDFWEMAMEYSSTIVMLCSVKEDGRAKCAQYWPLNVDESIQKTDEIRRQRQTITCKGKSIDKASEAVVRKLSLEIVDEANHVRHKFLQHIHFESWPDHDITTIDTITALLDLCVKTHAMSDHPEQPIIIHCSAGCGRTGTLIALHALQQDPSQDVVALVDRLRKQRIASVQAPSQFDLLLAFQESRR